MNLQFNNATAKNSILTSLMAIVMGLAFTACTDDDNNSNNGNGGNGDDPTAEVITYDDLNFFQNAIIEVDSVGDMMTRYYGVILDEADRNICISVSTTWRRPRHCSTCGSHPTWSRWPTCLPTVR